MGEKKFITFLDQLQEIHKFFKKRRINKPTCRVDIRHSSLSQEHLDHRFVSQIPAQKAQINAGETAGPNHLLGAMMSQSEVPFCHSFCLWLQASQFSSLYKIQIMIFNTLPEKCCIQGNILIMFLLYCNIINPTFYQGSQECDICCFSSSCRQIQSQSV